MSIMKIRQFYESAAQSYDQRHSNYATQYMRYFEKKLIKKYARGRILDIGCGTGVHLSFLENAVGIDISRSMLMEARQKSENSLVQCRAEELPFSNNSFDTALCMFTTLNLCNFNAAVREMKRVLKPGGIAIVSVSSVWDRYNENFLRKLLWKESKRKNVRIEGEHVAFHIFSKLDFLNLFLRNGFELAHFDSLFALQKPYWGWHREFSQMEKLKLRIERLLPKTAGRMYYGVFKKTANVN